MALGITVAWNVNGISGNDFNGGGFDSGVTSPGTDLSYPTSSPVTITDLVIGATNTTATSAANPFSSASVGNIYNSTSGTGFTVGRYTIVSVSGSTATFDRALGTASSTGGHGILGGAFATPAAALAVQTTSQLVKIADNGSFYDVGSGLATSAAASTVSASVPANRIFGYGTTLDDGGRPTLKLTSSIANNVLTINTDGWFVQDLILDANYLSYARTILFVNNSRYHRLSRLWVKNWSDLAGINSIDTGSLSAWIIIQDCEIGPSTASTRDGIDCGGTVTKVINCYIHDIAASGINALAVPHDGAQLFIGNIIANCSSGYGIAATAASMILDNRIYNASSTGIYLLDDGSYRLGFCRNNTISNCGGYGLDADASRIWDSGNYDGNAYYNNTSGSRSAAIGGVSSRDIILTAAPDVNASSHDFRLNNNAGGGAALRGMGYPRSWPGLDSIPNARDMGAYQHTDPTGGGGSGGVKRRPY